jgi:hypothetical protein
MTFLNQIVTKENNNVHISCLGLADTRVATTAPGASRPAGLPRIDRHEGRVIWF